MAPETILNIAKGVGGLLASVATEKVIEKYGRKLIQSKR